MLHQLAAICALLQCLVYHGISAIPTVAPRFILAEPDPSMEVSVQVAGKTFVNKGLVAFGLIPSNFTDSTGNTLGGIGSAIQVKPGSFYPRGDGAYYGTFIVQPDRGFNIDGTVDYQARQHVIDFVLSPYYGADDLSFTTAQQTLQLDYKSTLLYYERNSTKTTGLDSLAIRPQQAEYPQNPLADPPMPIPNATYNHLCTDAEGLAINSDGTWWTSDEYGPYIYRYSSTGNLIQTIAPPPAILPMVNGKLNFTSVTDPTTGRAGNQGFEGLSLDPSGQTLYALLQSATIQDGGFDKTTSRYTRLLAYNITTDTPTLVGEWIVPLPITNNKGNTLAASEMHSIGNELFLVLSRDGKGHGGSDNKSSYKQADLVDITAATDIHNTVFDSPSNPIAVNGVLNSSITAATYTSFVNYINDTQLARFGLHNGSPADQTLIDAKWESLSLEWANDSSYPDDYFLFTASDNDFMTTDGISVGVPYNAGLDNDNQFMVFRVTLPGTSLPGR
ncbi:hypothetical protein NEOLEDRAFT_1244195 [Neolentinus lepideus HHB14362 ss-1]|uniref:Phytase-like domain-containing protein n=1 Tax=Neolentinus lepideus HHB14362 ss-1 TaxID=1314782 RepID=A0A165Q7R7_9AGAM|nr:hypothetical protein NEOLEDRAFT_1244195 [Neolentinus lepideus HHB14362 ss-1]